MQIVFYVLLGVAVLLLLIGLSIANFSGNNLLDKFEYINNKMSSSFTVASNFAAQVSIVFLNSKVRVGQKEGFLTDAYMPSKKVVFLSEKVYSSSTVAALAITAHELGHALQDAQSPKTLRKRESLGTLAKVLGFFMFPLFIAGLVLFFAYPESLLPSLACLIGAIAIFILALSVKLVTISIEKDASVKAIFLLKQLNVLNQEELVFAKKLLDAALLTYIGDFLRAILSWTMLTKKSKLFS